MRAWLTGDGCGRAIKQVREIIKDMDVFVVDMFGNGYLIICKDDETFDDVYKKVAEARIDMTNMMEMKWLLHTQFEEYRNRLIRKEEDELTIR